MLMVVVIVVVEREQMLRALENSEGVFYRQDNLAVEQLGKEV